MIGGNISIPSLSKTETMKKRIIAWIAAFLGVCVFAPLFAAVYHHGLTAADLQQKYQQYKQRGLRIVLLDGYTVGGKVYYLAAWDKGNGKPWRFHYGMTAKALQNKFKSYSKEGYRPVQVEGYSVNGKAYYAAIWEKRSGAYYFYFGLSNKGFQKKFNDLRKKGYRLRWVSGYGVGKKDYYAAIWEKRSGPAYRVHHGMSSQSYNKKVNDYAKQGYRPVLISGYDVNGKDYYAAIWEKRSGPRWSARHRLSNRGYQNEFDNHHFQGFRLVHASAYSRNGKAQFAAIWESRGIWKGKDLNHINGTITKFMKKKDIKGAAVGIVKDGRLVFARGYGFMDDKTYDPVGPRSLFRIASVSKLITGVAVMKLHEEGRLNIEDKVFGSGALLGKKYGKKKYHSREKAIRVRHLLEHTAGGTTWDNQGGDDPMFQKLDYDHAKLIGWVLDKRNPSANPGSTYAYSNFGYCVLGRVIEQVTGQSYESYVRENILKPCGIRSMRIAGDKESQRRWNEVKYFDKNAYGMKVRRMDAHGGWLGSALDLMRFIVRVDGSPSKPDLIDRSTFNLMTTGSNANMNYGKGWSINGGNLFHTGALPGTGAILVRTGNGLSWVFLANKTWDGDMDSLMWEVVNGVNNWPSVDFF